MPYANPTPLVLCAINAFGCERAANVLVGLAASLGIYISICLCAGGMVHVFILLRASLGVFLPCAPSAKVGIRGGDAVGVVDVSCAICVFIAGGGNGAGGVNGQLIGTER